MAGHGRIAWYWAMYDWANSAFATTVMAVFFPVFLKQYWSAGVAATTGTLRLGVANSVASLVIALLAPVLGAIADRGAGKKRFLISFAMLGIAMTGALFLVQKGDWPTAVALYVLAMVGFTGGNVFYDSMLLDVASSDRLDAVSALGFGLGYLGGGLLLALNVLMTLHPAWFGLADQSTAVRVSFLTVAIWWALFSLPLVTGVHERKVEDAASGLKAVRAGLRQLRGTFRAIRGLREVFLFLFAYWLYIDGVNTVIEMAVDYGLSLGFPASSLVLAVLITQFVGFPAAIAFGWIGSRFGARTGIYLAIVVYVLVTIFAASMREQREFYVLAISIGCVQGGIQSLSRSLYARLIPSDKAAEFFGFYGLLGKFAAILGPLLMGWVAVYSSSSRLALLSVIVLFVAGGVLLAFVRVANPRAEA